MLDYQFNMVRDLDKMFITLLGNDSASQSFSHISMVGVFGTCPIHNIVINFLKFLIFSRLIPLEAAFSLFEPSGAASK